MPTYEETIAVTDATTLQSEMTAELAANGVTLTGFSPTSAERGLIALDARARSVEQGIRAEVVKSGFLLDVENRDEAWIDLQVYGFFRVARLLETRARHLFTLTNQSATGGPHTIKAAGASGPGISLEAQAINGQRFRNTTGGVLQAGIGQTLHLEFEALTAGLEGNIAPGQIFKLLGGALPGVDISNSVDSIVAAARRRETNREYVDRAVSRWGTLAAGGHVDAVTYRILTGIESLTKLGVRDDNPNGQSSVEVYLANAAGPATNDECTAAATLFGRYEPLGSRGRWLYLPAVARVVDVEATLELDGTNPNAIANASAALSLLAAQWPMRAGVKLDETLVKAIIRGGAFEQYVIPGFRGVGDADTVAPLDDVVLDVGEVLVFNINLTEA
ncbi:MAG: baseplate J/gp47 family protein [Polyangiaceae bacterium]|nr:baseplate J/gp47 family protein [Polyangiaceae bacterium]